MDMCRGAANHNTTHHNTIRYIWQHTIQHKAIEFMHLVVFFSNCSLYCIELCCIVLNCIVILAPRKTSGWHALLAMPGPRHLVMQMLSDAAAVVAAVAAGAAMALLLMLQLHGHPHHGPHPAAGSAYGLQGHQRCA